MLYILRTLLTHTIPLRVCCIRSVPIRTMDNDIRTNIFRLFSFSMVAMNDAPGSKLFSMTDPTTTKTGSAIPSMMIAAQQNGYGNVRDVLSLEQNVPVPRELSPNQILVRVHAASINPIDWKTLNGNMSMVKRYSFPHIPGNDVSGVVVDVGSSVKRLQIGNKVYGNLGGDGGTYAEYVRGNESRFALKPNNLSMVEAAAVPLACEVSYQVLFNKASPPIGPGSKVFVCGGSTATGLFAIQLAKAVNALVTTTCSPRNFSLMEKLGYKVVQDSNKSSDDPRHLSVFDYNSKDFGKELAGQNYDVVYDCVGGAEQWTTAQNILKPGGQFITIVGDDTESKITLKTMAAMGTSLMLRKLQSIFSYAHHQYIVHVLNQSYQGLDDIRTKYIETGKVKPLIDTVFDLRKEGVDALYKLYEKSKSGKAQGKLVLKIVDEE